MRHRAPELWGPDAAEWNPDREFSDEELGFGVPMHGFNPASPRFSPFTYGPRDCMGRNFAQMEMRIILAYLLRSFDFELAGPVAEPRFDRAAYADDEGGSAARAAESAAAPATVARPSQAGGPFLGPSDDDGERSVDAFLAGVVEALSSPGGPT